MRPLAAVLLCCHVMLASAASGEQTFPYRACALSDDVYVRSGPGQNYYPTDKLKRGQEVEVYRHDPGGRVRHSTRRRKLHLGIRPIPEAATEERLAGGHRGRRASRGSAAASATSATWSRCDCTKADGRDSRRAAWRTAGQGDSGWFKIAPPSGELPLGFQ